MSIALAYIYPILFSLLFGYYNGWQWTDEQDGVYDPKKAKPRWKASSVQIRALAMSAPVMFIITGLELDHFIIGVAISLPLFDITINRTRGEDWFYLGTTSETDKWKIRIKRKGKVLLTLDKWHGYVAIIFATVMLKILV